MNRVKEKIGYDAALRLGLTGRGVGVAVMDTGVFLHPDYGKRVIGFADMVNRKREPYDDCGHGSHVCGIIGGSGVLSDGQFCGMAPRCNLIAVKVLDRKGNGYATDVLAGIDWLLNRKDALGIRIVNISVGSGGKKKLSEDSALVRGVNRAWDAGLVVVVAAGNNGPGRMTITTPGISRKVITVGCSDDDQEILVGGKRMVDYSGRGPTAECICKPDVIAPGKTIISCASRNGKYAMKSGTSMSTPIVSGAIALLLEKYPDMTNRDVKLRLMESSRNLGLPKNQQGWGMLDLERLLI